MAWVDRADLRERPTAALDAARGRRAPGRGENMPDASSAAHRRRADRAASGPGGLLLSGIEPVDSTWFETGDDALSDEPLILLVPVRHERRDQ
jgi:hypothetical protein